VRMLTEYLAGHMVCRSFVSCSLAAASL
jgi:hypothetical protein